MARLDLTSASFSHLELTGERGAEALTFAAPAEGEIAIAGRGYARAREIAAFLAREGGGTMNSLSGPAGTRCVWRTPMGRSSTWSRR